MTETLTFQAETSRLLDLVIHSLYSHPEIFLRELMSNASDALDRYRLESLLKPELIEDDKPLEIRLEVDPAARTLTVRDNGIGMSREEVVSHIGTIARSGTQEALQQLGAKDAREQVQDLIGKFGVGFYSSFMVADRVTLVTRRAGEVAGTRWESNGDARYSIDDAGAQPRGTAVVLHLKPVDPDGVNEDYTDRWILTRIVKRYADFLTYPISYVGPDTGVEGAVPAPTASSTPAPVVLNSMTPLWKRSEAEVKPAEYQQFYNHIAGDIGEPMLRMSFKAEGRWEYSALIFVPPHAPYNLSYQGLSFGLQVYAQRVKIIENCQDVLPRYLRFLKGVVDVADLPLNVSRQSLQSSHHIAQLRRWITRKVLETLKALQDKDAARYLTFWREYGRALKEGVSEDRDQKERLLPLFLFESSSDSSRLTTLAEYVARMPPEQQHIFYLTGESRAVIERSPHLEEFRARGYEVLYLTEPVDELLVDAVHEFQEHRLRSVAKGQVDLGDEAEREKAAQAVKEQTQALDALIGFLAKRFEAHVRSVRISTRLTVSPACLAGEEHDFSPQLERLLAKGTDLPRTRRILELNPKHPLVTSLQARLEKNPDDPIVPAAADLLLGAAALAEGSELPDAVGFTGRLTEVLVRIATVEA
jgi:molecular chaperone HtpG